MKRHDEYETRLLGPQDHFPTDQLPPASEQSTLSERTLRWPVILIALVALAILGALAISVLLPKDESGAALGSTLFSRQPAAMGTEADGAISDRNPISYDANVPALTRLQPEVRDALIQAGHAAKGDGVDLRVTSGWRSPQLQQQLQGNAVKNFGAQEANKLVKSPELSEHVQGRAVDIGPTKAADWMGRNGNEFGFCQTYSNEMWHFELTAVDGECPPQKADATN